MRIKIDHVKITSRIISAFHRDSQQKKINKAREIKNFLL